MRGVFSSVRGATKRGSRERRAVGINGLKSALKNAGRKAACLPPRAGAPPCRKEVKDLGLVEEILVYARELSVVRVQRADASEATTPHSSGDLPAERTPRSSRKTRPPEGTLRS